MPQPNTKIYANAAERQRAYRKRLKRRAGANRSGVAERTLEDLYAAIASAKVAGNPLAIDVHRDNAAAMAMRLTERFFRAAVESVQRKGS